MVSETRGAYGACLSKLGRRREAEEHLLAAVAGLRSALGEENARTRKAAAALAELYDAWGRTEEAALYRTSQK